MAHYDKIAEKTAEYWQSFKKDVAQEQKHDPVNFPQHYTTHPSGIQPIELTRYMSFCLGNVLKYILRADYKGKKLEDLKKAQFYLNEEIKKLEEEQPND